MAAGKFDAESGTAVSPKCKHPQYSARYQPDLNSDIRPDQSRQLHNPGITARAARGRKEDSAAITEATSIGSAHGAQPVQDCFNDCLFLLFWQLGIVFSMDPDFRCETI